MLKSNQSHDYWRRRHKDYKGQWQSVGCQVATPALNQVLYDCRLAALRKLLDKWKVDPSSRNVLDGGCGLGTFSRFYAEKGANVYGIDLSMDAISICNSLSCGTFAHGLLAELKAVFTVEFDIIHCFDVLYHIVDDSEWLSTLRSLEGASSKQVIWFITEFHTSSRSSPAAHMVKRPFREYDFILRTLGLEIVDEVPLYWFYSLFPKLANHFPRLVTTAESTGKLVAHAMPERVVVWVVKRLGV